MQTEERCNTICTPIETQLIAMPVAVNHYRIKGEIPGENTYALGIVDIYAHDK